MLFKKAIVQRASSTFYTYTGYFAEIFLIRQTKTKDRSGITGSWHREIKYLKEVQGNRKAMAKYLNVNETFQPMENLRENVKIFVISIGQFLYLRKSWNKAKYIKLDI